MDNDLNMVPMLANPIRGDRASVSMPRIRPRAILLSLLALAAGCHQAVPPSANPPPPPVLTGTTHYLGTPLSGVRADPAPESLAPGNAWAVEVTIVSLDQMPGGGEPLSGQSTLVTASRGESAVLPSARLTRGARIASLPDPAAFASVFASGQPTTLLTARGAVPVGATASFKATEEAPRVDRATGRIWRRGVEVDVFRPVAPATTQNSTPANAIEVALAVDDYAQPDRVESSAEAPAPVAPAAPPSPQHEVAIVDLKPEPNAQTVAIAVPFRFERWHGQAVAAIVTISPPSSDPAHVQAVAQCLADLRVSSAIAASRPHMGLAGGDEGSALRVAVTALNAPDRRRSAMIYLAGATGAALCADAALVADDATLGRVAGEVYNSAWADPPDEAAVGWLLDQTWFLDMGELLGNAKLSPELSAVLATHAGEVGRHPSSIEEVGKAGHSHADFESLLLAENMIFLEDGSPSARARAFDWLQARGKAPAGYAPLDPPKQRREALERAALGLPPATAPATAPTSEPATEPVETATAPSTEPATGPSTAAPTTEATEPGTTTMPATQPVPFVPEPGPPTVWETIPRKPATAPALTEPAAFVPEPGPPTVWETVPRKPATAPALTEPAAFVPEPGPPTVWETVPRKPATAQVVPSTQPTTTPSQEAPHE